jgi:hypothetical protein
MELGQNPENANVHKWILHSLLDYLKLMHLDLIRREALSIQVEPGKSYMLEFEGKVSRALKRQRIRLQLPMPALPKEEKIQKQHEISTSRTGMSRRRETSCRSNSQKKGEKEKNTPQGVRYFYTRSKTSSEESRPEPQL